MAKSNPVEVAYSMGRVHPYAAPHDLKTKSKEQTYEQPDPAQQQVQDPEAKHGPGYDNDAQGWVRGHGKPHPYFDSGPSGNRHK